MKKGDLIFVRRNNWLGKLIRYFDKGEFSHVAIMLDPDSLTVLDARLFGGVKPRGFDFNDYEIVSVEGDIDKAVNLIGLKYDKALFIWHGIKYLASKVGLSIKVQNNPKEMICSEYVAYYMGRGDLFNKKPNEIYRELVETKEGV